MIFPSWLGFVFILHFVHVMHFISCHHVHRISICVRLMHPSIFPVVRFAIRHSYMHRRTPLVSFRERVSNVLRMDRDLPSGLGTPPVDRLSNFVPFGVRLILQLLTEEPQRPRVCCNQTPLQNGPITNPNLSHVFRCRTTTAWSKTTPHLDTTTSS